MWCKCAKRFSLAHEYRDRHKGEKVNEQKLLICQVCPN